MTDELISGHKRLAMEGLGPLGAVESAFKSGIKQPDPGRGTLLDSQRGATKSGKTDHGYDKDDGGY
jgi:hypothetical protein